MSVKVEARPLTDSLPGGAAPGTTVTVEPLLGGEMRAPGAYLESRGGRAAGILAGLSLALPRSRWHWVPVPAFLVRHPNAGPLLIDTALHPSVRAKPHENLGRATAAITDFRFPDGDLASQLRNLGLDPKEIETVVLTHLHYDHSSGITEFSNSTFVLSSREWGAATTGRRPLLHGYRREHFDYLFDYRLVDFDGPLIDSYATFGRTFDLFGDGSVRLAFTPGHTLGHVSVVLRLRERDLVIAGDAVYTESQLAGDNVPARPEDEHQWQRSRRELQRFADRFPSALIVPGHDADAWERLESRYE